MLDNNCVDWPLLNSTGSRLLSPSSPNNQPVISINNCVNWPCLHSSQKGTCFSCVSQQSTGNVDQQLCWLTLYWLDTKGTPFSFMQQSTGNVNQQLCQSTLSQFDTKETPFSFTQQSTSNADQQLCRSTLSQFDMKGTPCSFMQQSTTTMTMKQIKLIDKCCSPW